MPQIRSVKLLIRYVSGNTTRILVSKLPTDHLFGYKGYLVEKDWELVGIKESAIPTIESIKFITWI
jgi:hypothetical protein